MSRRQWRSRLILPLVLLCCSMLLSGCMSSLIGKQSSQNFKEQLYIDARLDFAIQHPLDWQLRQVPVSSTQYRADTVRWTIKEIKEQQRGAGEILIRSRIADPGQELEDLLNSYLSGQAELESGLVEKFDHPAGPALKLLGHDTQRGHLTVALKGQRRDFIIALDFPSGRFDELLPIFEDIVDSFVEVVKPEPTE